VVKKPKPPGVVLSVTVVATFLVLVAFTLVAPTVQDTAATFHASVTWRTWALSATSLGLAATLLTAGTIADRVGRRRTMQVGLIGLVLTTALQAAAPSMAVFVGARIAAGVASSAVVAAALAIVGHAFPSGRERVRATGIWAAALGAGIAIGPVLSALMARASDWRAAYWLTAALTALVAIWAARVPESRSPAPLRPDYRGSISLIGGMGALTAAVITGRQGWESVDTLVLFAIAAVMLVAFAAIELRVSEPMLDLRVFRRPDFVNSILGALVVGMTTIALMSYASTYFERAIGMSALGSSLLLGAWSTTSAFVSWHAHRVSVRLTSRHRLIVGLLICAAGLAWLAQAGIRHGSVSLLPGLVLTGIGTGITNAALGQLAVASAPPGRPGLGGGANNTARYLGGSAGVAMVIALAVPHDATPTSAQLVDGWSAASAVCAALCVVGALAAAGLRQHARGATWDVPAAERSDVRAAGEFARCCPRVAGQRSDVSGA
jgi:MFS family permease